MNRRAHLIDAAIAVLSQTGARGLTHRAVDDEASLPSGSTSNLFRTRHALVTAVVEELLRRSSTRLRAAFEASATLGSAAASFVGRTLDEARHEVRARMALLADSDASALRAARERLLEAGAQPGELGHPEASGVVVAMIDGILFDAVILDRPVDVVVVDRAVTAVVASLAPRVDPRRR